jgi:hypothetical protein
MSTIDYWDVVDAMTAAYDWLEDFRDIGPSASFSKSSSALESDPAKTIDILADFVILGLGAQFCWRLRLRVPVGQEDPVDSTIETASMVIDYVTSFPEQTARLALTAWLERSASSMLPA